MQPLRLGDGALAQVLRRHDAVLGAGVHEQPAPGGVVADADPERRRALQVHAGVRVARVPVPGRIHHGAVAVGVLERRRVHPVPATVLRVVHAHELASEVADAEREVLPVPDVPPGLAQREADRAELEPRRAVERAEHPHGHVGARAAHGRLHVRVELRAVDVAAAHGAAPLAAGDVDPALPVVAPAAREVGPLAVDLLPHGVPAAFVQRGAVLEEPGDGRRQVHLLGVEEQRGAVVPDHRVRLLQRRHRRQVELDVAQARHALLPRGAPEIGRAHV